MYMIDKGLAQRSTDTITTYRHWVRECKMVDP